MYSQTNEIACWRGWLGVAVRRPSSSVEPDWPEHTQFIFTGKPFRVSPVYVLNRSVGCFTDAVSTDGSGISIFRVSSAESLPHLVQF